MEIVNATCALESTAELGEGAIWDARISRLWWVDILKGRLNQFDPATRLNKIFEVGGLVGTVVPELGRDLALAVKNGFASYDTATGGFEMLAAMEHENPTIRFNDGKCDPQGRFWAGTMAVGGRAGAGNLVCLERDLSVSRKIKGVSISNGLGWNPEGNRMYYIDSPTQRVLAFEFNGETGAISAPRVAVEIPASEGSPDGMCVDAEGKLWIAIWGAGKAARFDPKSGERLAEVRVQGALQTSSVALGGPDLKTLFITSAREHLNAAALLQQPLAGSLFSAEVGVAGLPANSFKRL